MKSARTHEKYVIGYCRKFDTGEYAASDVTAESRLRHAAGYARAVCKATGETFPQLCERLHISVAARDTMIRVASFLAPDGSWTDLSEKDVIENRLTAVLTQLPEQLDLLRSIAASNIRIAAALERLAPELSFDEATAILSVKEEDRQADEDLADETGASADSDFE
jgi:hypothetical protein